MLNIFPEVGIPHHGMVMFGESATNIVIFFFEDCYDFFIQFLNLPLNLTLFIVNNFTFHVVH